MKKGSPGSECAEWAWGPCTPSSKDCGAGFREGACGAQTQRIRCRVPCNWKKEFGGKVRRRWRARNGGKALMKPEQDWRVASGRPALTLGALPPADCKYKFENWGSCDGGSGTKAHQGTLKKAYYNAQFQETICTTKTCIPKTKAKAKPRKGRERLGLNVIKPLAHAYLSTGPRYNP